jgi:hypothetical protein
MVVDVVDSSSLGGAFSNGWDDVTKHEMGPGELTQARRRVGPSHTPNRVLRKMVEELGA